MLFYVAKGFIQRKNTTKAETMSSDFEERKLVHKSHNESKMYVITDSTKHYQHIREVEEQRKIADDANKAKTEFLASMSHEIRTPINAVLGIDEMILRESKDDTIREYAMDIQTAGRTLYIDDFPFFT